jgi:hypothetical protein
MCECLNVFRTTYNTYVCELCGVETSTPLEIYQRVAPRNMAPFPVGYSRSKRFTKILDGVLYPTPSSADQKMLAFLENHRIDSIEHLLKTMKKSPTRDKRYVSLHCFAKLFVKNYKAPPRLNYFDKRKCILNEFEHILFGHQRYCAHEQFFNYNWLICVLLEKFGMKNLVVYVKNLRCCHRKDFYRDLLQHIRRSYRLQEARVGASKTRTQPSEQSGGRRLLPDPIPRQPTTGEALLRRYIRDHTDGNRSGSAGSCQLRREDKSSAAGDQTDTPRPAEPV